MISFMTQLETNCIINAYQNATSYSHLHQSVLLPFWIWKQVKNFMSQINHVIIPGNQADFAFVTALPTVEIKFLILLIPCTVPVIIYVYQHMHINGTKSQAIHKHDLSYIFQW